MRRLDQLLVLLLGTFVSGSWAQSECNFVVLAPNVFHYGVKESVTVMLVGSAAKNVQLRLLDYYQSGTALFTTETKPVTEKGTFEMTVNPTNINSRSEEYKLSDNHYVILEATCDGRTQQTTILLSDNEGTVFIQTDKPIYTPSQKVNIRVYTTDFYNKPLNASYISLDIVAPTGTIVERQTHNTSYSGAERLQYKVTGLLEHKFHIAKKPSIGKWKVAVRYGVHASHQSEVEFEVEEYVLPTFSCEVSLKNQYALLDDYDMDISGTVYSKYTFGQSLRGRVRLRYGVTRNDQKDITYHISSSKEFTAIGEAPIQLKLREVYDKVGSEYKALLQDERLVVEATCFDQGSGENMVDSNQQISFVDAPYEFNFRRTKKYFKPDLPLVLQVQLMHKNGNPAKDTSIKFSGYAIKQNVRVPLELVIGQQIKAITNHYGFAHVVYSADSQATSVEVKLQVDYKFGDSTKALVNTYTLQKSDAEHDIAIKTDLKLLNSTASITVDTYLKGSGPAMVSWIVLSKGQIVKVVYAKAVSTSYVPQKIQLDHSMVPSARLLVFFVRGNQIGGDALWIDLIDECQKPITITARNTDKENKKRYMWKKHLKAELVISANSNSNLVVQMVDHAILALNDRVTLSKQKMFSNLEALDLGCFGGGGGSAAEVFKLAGLSVATLLKSNTDPSLVVKTSMRLNETCSVTSRSKREVEKPRPDAATCCEYAKSTTRFDCDGDVHALVANISLVITTECALSFKQCCEEVSSHTGKLGGSVGDIKEYVKEYEKNHGVRRKFPESVMFDIITTNENGEGILQFDLPDTITTWSLETVELNNVAGMCVADPFNFQVWKDAFLKIRFPHHAIKGEQLNARATLYNTGAHNRDVNFYMRGVEGLCSEARNSKYTYAKYRTLPGKKAVSVSFPIVPLEVGSYKVTFLVLSGKKVLDIVEHTLTVHSDGLAKVVPISFLLSPSSSDNPEYCSGIRGGKIKCIIPIHVPQHIPKTASASLSISGNIIGPVVDIILTGLEQYIKIPTGCGEQTMSKFAPNIYFFNYMEKTNTLSVERTMDDNIRNGVNQMLQYQKSKNSIDAGGISLWADAWYTTYTAYPSLTAYVLKVFAKAHTLRPHLVDKYWITGPRQYLFSQQMTHGSKKGGFPEYNQYYLSTNLDILIALLESGKSYPMENKWHNQLKDSTTYIERQFTGDNLERNLMCSKFAYALSMADSSFRGQAYSRLQERAVNSIVKGVHQRYFEESYVGSKISTAAYAVLAALEHNDLEFCHNIIKWLNAQKTNSGLFQSTRDTAVAFQALAAYATVIRGSQTDLTIDITDNMDKQLANHIIKDDDVNREYIYNMNREHVEKGNYQVIIVAGGVGNASVMVNTNYNIDGEETCGFKLIVRRSKEIWESNDIKTKNEVGMPPDSNTFIWLRLYLEIDVSYNGEGKTDMAMIEIDLLSGYAAEKDSLEMLKEKKTIDEYEINGRTVAIYLTQIYSNNVTTVRFSAKQEDYVDNISPAKVIVYDYYKRESQCSTFYADCSLDTCPALLESKKTDWELNVQNNFCYEDECSECYGIGIGKEEWREPFSYEKFKKVICSPKISYVLRVKYINTTKDRDNSAWTYTYMQVKHVLKKGNFDLKQQVIRFAQLRVCPCPKIKDIVKERGFPPKNRKSAVFFVMGKKESRAQPTADGTGTYIYSYVLDKESYLQQWNWARTGPHMKLIEYLRNPCHQI